MLGRFTSADDLPEAVLEDFEGVTYLPWDQSLSLEEVERCTIGISSTSPGTDKITVRLLKACWSSVKHKIHRLFEKCLLLSHFPSAWKGAEVAMIPKVGPGRDRSSVRSWRPIALLSCISKGFERVISKRLSWTALTHNVFSSQHAGALPKRSATDLVAALTHDLEQALARGKQATLVTLDVQGAFDALPPNRLLKRMQDQGWPLAIVRLVRSFLADRRVRVRLEDCTTIFHDVTCGTPQGSPLSPVLYMLYLTELLRQDVRYRFGYADDIALYRASNTLEENVELLQEDVKKILQWGDENKVFFAPEKMELMHFSNKRRSTAPLLHIREGRTLTPITTADKAGQQPALKWLGVWFDKKLRFRRHVSERVAKARKVAGHIRSLARTKDGPPASSLRKAVITCVLSSALYGTEAWYAGKLKPAQTGPQDKEVKAKIGGLTRMIQSAITLAARGVLPAWRTVPITTLIRDSGLPSAEVALEDSRARFAYRIQSADKEHPLTKRIPFMPTRVNERPRPSKIQTAAALLPKAPRPELRAPYYSPNCLEDPTNGVAKEMAAEAFKLWWATLPTGDITVFSDGSEQWKDGIHGVGYGYAVYQNCKKLEDGLGSIHEVSHVFDAEAIGAWKGLQAALRNPSSRGRRIWMCIDSTSVIWCLRGQASDSSQWAFHRCQDAFSTNDIRVKWAPGHTGIEGNEEADWLADRAANPANNLPCPDPLSHNPTLSGIKSISRRMKRTAMEGWWAKTSPLLSRQYRKWGLTYEIKPLPELDLPRATLQRLLAIRTGHGDFDWYHRTRKHEDAKLVCMCGRLKTPEHIVHCAKIRRYFWNWPHKPKHPPRDDQEGVLYLQTLFSKPQSFAELLNLTNFYSKVCTR